MRGDVQISVAADLAGLGDRQGPELRSTVLAQAAPGRLVGSLVDGAGELSTHPPWGLFLILLVLVAWLVSRVRLR